MRVFSTKTYPHSLGLSCCFRQWRADSHCSKLHGYAFQVKLVFGTFDLDKNGWVMDFGNLKDIKEWLCAKFDHKLVVAADDPCFDLYTKLAERGAADLVVLKRVGCEAFAAEVIFPEVDFRVKQKTNSRVWLEEVHLNEHEGNGVVIKRGH